MAPFGASRAGLMSTRVDAIPDSGGDHQWDKDEGSDSTIADSIGTLDGTLVNNPSWADDAGAGGFYIDYNGTDQYADLGSDSRSELRHFTDDGKGTLFAWVNPDDVSGQNMIIGSSISTGDTAPGFGLVILDDGDIRFVGVTDTEGEVPWDITASDVIGTGDGWVPVAGTLDGSTARIYVGDGMTEEASGPIDSGDLESNDLEHNASIAREARDDQRHFDGGIDLVWTDNVERSQSDLQDFVNDSEDFYS